MHLLDEDTQRYSTPSIVRKRIGIVIAAIYGLHMGVGLIGILGFSGVLLMGGESLGAIAMLFIGLFCIGLYTIPGWLFVDWEKARLLSRGDYDRQI